MKDIDLEDRMGGKYYEVEIEARDVGGSHTEAEYISTPSPGRSCSLTGDERKAFLP